MRVAIVTPAPAGSRVGNRVTALRWALLLRRSGHAATVDETWRERGADVFVAMHAIKSADALERQHAEHPTVPTVLVLTGTDVYGGLDTPEARRSLELAERVVVLQERALAELPDEARAKARVVRQSAPRLEPPPRDQESFEVCVLGHLRPVKDPFLTARAVRLLPDSSRVRVTHVGAALSDDMRARAEQESATNPRYDWVGPRRRGQALRLLARARLSVISSRNEGGPSAVPESIACSVPVVSTRMPAATALLGDDYPGLYPVGDERALAELLERAASDADFYGRLLARCEALRPGVDPELERAALAHLVSELVPGGRRSTTTG